MQRKLALIVMAALAGCSDASDVPMFEPPSRDAAYDVGKADRTTTPEKDGGPDVGFDGPSAEDVSSPPPEGSVMDGRPPSPDAPLVDGALSDHTLVDTVVPDGAKPDTSPPHDAGDCRLVLAIPFNAKGSTIYKENGKEYRDLLADLPGVGTLTVRVYSGPVGGFQPLTVNLGCTVGTPCLSPAELFVQNPGNDYGPLKGTIKITTVTSPDSTGMTGTVSDLKFQRTMTVQDGSVLTPYLDPNGDCITVGDFSFDTNVAVGMPCSNSSDCGTAKVCSVASQSCAPSECDAPNQPSTCPSGQMCFSRDAPNNVMHGGYCTQPCDVFTPCPAGYSCSWGYCKHVGPSSLGQSCTVSDVGSGCAAGLMCAPAGFEPQRCRTSCNPYVANPGCSSQDRCLHDYCVPPLMLTSNASIDQPCNMNDTVGTACADDGKTYRGICYKALGTNDTPICRRICDPRGSACPTGQQCTASPGLGQRMCM
jgi:hypothetical protein